MLGIKIFKRISINIILVMGICFTSFNPAIGDVYRWVDENGRVHYGDSHSAAKAQNTQIETVELDETDSKWETFTIQVNTHNVELTEIELANFRADVEAVYKFYDAALFFDIYKTVPVKVELFADKSSYVRYIDRVAGYDANRSSGIFMPKLNSIAVYIQENRERTFATLRHEVSHAIIYTIAPSTPSWLNEGMAEQMETLTYDKDHFIFKRHAYNHASVQRSGLDISVKQMLTQNSDAWRSHNTNGNFVYQAMAGELVYFLLSSRNGQSFITRILHEYSRGSRVKSRFLIDKNYIGGLPSLENQWKLWVLDKGASSVRVNF